MNNEPQVIVTPYRWVILIITWCVLFMGVFAQFQIAALAFKIIPQLHLSPAQFAEIMSAPMVPAILFSIIGGGLADRFGVKVVVSVAFVFAIIGMIFRYAATNFWEFFILMFMSGLCSALINANFTKLFGYWFPKDQMTKVMGVITAGSYAGITVTLAVSALFPTTKSAYLTAGFIMLVLFILWLIFIKNKPEGAPPMPVMPVSKYIGVAARSRGVWLGGIVLLLWMGSDMGYQEFFPNALHAVRGLSPQLAGFMVSFITFGSLVGAILGPFVVHRIKKLKTYVTPMAFVIAVIMMVTWLVHSLAGTWILLALGGLLTGTIPPLVFSFPILLPEVGPDYAGSAGGFMATIQLIGAFCIPSFVIAPIAGTNYTLLFFVSSALFFLIGIVAIFFPPVGASGRLADMPNKVEAGA